MFLSNPAQYLLSFFNLIELLVECSATRSSLKQLKTITVVESTQESPCKPRRDEKKNKIERDNGSDDNEANENEKIYHTPLPYGFVFILKLWTLYAFIALYSRHLEPLFRYIPGYYMWNTGKTSIMAVLEFIHYRIYCIPFRFISFSLYLTLQDMLYAKVYLSLYYHSHKFPSQISYSITYGYILRV